jgi:uncharacterized protein YidB (DUF937 family)
MASNRMLALLGLLAVAGYQNRDRIGEFIGRLTGQGNAPGDQLNPDPTARDNGLDGLLGGLSGLLSGAQGGIAGGLGDLVDRLKNSGHGDAAHSWVETGPNNELDEADLRDALGGDTITELTRKTGLTEEELLARLKRVLPTAVDQMTPQGRLPTEAEASRWAA